MQIGPKDEYPWVQEGHITQTMRYEKRSSRRLKEGTQACVKWVPTLVATTGTERGLNAMWHPCRDGNGAEEWGWYLDFEEDLVNVRIGDTADKQVRTVVGGQIDGNLAAGLCDANEQGTGFHCPVTAKATHHQLTVQRNIRPHALKCPRADSPIETVALKSMCRCTQSQSTSTRNFPIHHPYLPWETAAQIPTGSDFLCKHCVAPRVAEQCMQWSGDGWKLWAEQDRVEMHARRRAHGLRERVLGLHGL
jgi:hypothetical protein